MLTVSWKPHLGYGPEWLRVAFPCPRLLTASQFWEGVSQEASDRETHPGRNWRDSDELASEVMKHCFYHVLLIKVSLESRGGKADFSFQWEVSKESVAIVNLPHTVAIFTTCLTRTHACFSKITEFETKKKLKPRYGVLHFDFRGNAYSDPLQLFLTSKNGEYPLGEKKKRDLH